MLLGGGHQADAAEATYSLGDCVYSGNNGNQVQDLEDTGLAGLTVTISDYAGNHVAITTDAKYLTFEMNRNGDDIPMNLKSLKL